MKENDVTAIAQLLGLDAEIVKVSEEEGTLSARVKDFTEKNVIRGKEDFSTYETNREKEIKETYLSELESQAKRGELNGSLYNSIKGAAMQMKEKELSEKLGIKDYKNLDDLIEKALKTTSGGTDDEKFKALQEKVEELQDANLKLDKKANEAVSIERQKYQEQFLKSRLETAINSLPFDFEGGADKEKVTKMMESLFKSNYSLSTDDNYSAVLVSDKNGVVKSEATREPVPVTEVLTGLAKEFNIKLKSPETGGQGGKSSGGSTKSKFATTKDLNAAIDRGELDPFSDEALSERRRLLNEAKK